MISNYLIRISIHQTLSIEASQYYRMIGIIMEKESKQSLPDIINHLPQSFFQFLKQKDISLDYFKELPSRYIRIKPGAEVSIKQLSEDISVDQARIKKIDDFFQLPSCANIHHSKLYSNSIIYGMDISSGWVVKALGLKDGLHHLELCCAPGNKIMYARDLMKGGSLTGVDINQNRMDVTRSLFRKYGYENDIRLFCEDATKFNKFTEDGQKYDRVLVDAECTHEGSLKHLRKFLNQIVSNPQKKVKIGKKQRQQYRKNNSNTYLSEQLSKNNWSKEDFEDRFLDKKKLANLRQLQSSLLKNGYRLLKEGGDLVYSTCSYDQSQNQKIVQEFLKDHPDAELVFPFENDSNIPYCKGSLKNTVRFNPVVSNTGGMFIAKIRKKKEAEKEEQSG